jgi:hypothetical protein
MPIFSRQIANNQTTWLHRQLNGRLQWNGLCQANKRVDAEQVGQHHRLLCQELTEGLHIVCSRPDALSFAHVASWRLWCVVVGSQVVSGPHLPQEWHRRAFYYPPSRTPTPAEPIAARFFKTAPSQKVYRRQQMPFAMAGGKCHTATHEQVVGTASQDAHLPPFRQGFPQKVS